ncbi:MAG: hypothetical protein J3Q66DRAFT_383318 [Benniella sp.]|nr:MAG: hypothetical protein J3Q66DRAFT_383318 [Benniella sp.]
MPTLPTFSSSCLAPGGSGQTVFLFGVPSSGLLEAHSIDLSDPLAPQATLISTAPSSSGTWNAQNGLGCYAYLGDNPPTNSPISVVQFGSTVQTLFSPNGTWTATWDSTTKQSVQYVSSKFFSIVGSTKGSNWLLAKTTLPSSTGGSTGSWRDIRIGGTVRQGSQELTVLGSEDPLLTVGALSQDVGNFGNGLLFSIDKNGSSGSVFIATGNKVPDQNLTATEPLVSLAKRGSLEMNEVILSNDAIPVPSASAALILDKGPAGTISVFSIDPRGRSNLFQSSVKGSAPRFLSGQSAAVVKTKVVVYGGLLQDGSGHSNSVHVFDLLSGTWSGPDLIDPTASGSGSRTLSMGVIGGIVAGALVVLIVVAMTVRRIRRNKHPSKENSSKGDGARENADDNTDKATMIKLLNIENESHAKPVQQEKRENHSNESSITLRDSTAPVPKTRQSTAPNTPRASNQRTRQSSRQLSTISTFSDNSSHISLFPVGSKVYLVNSPGIIPPPTPMIPSAYMAGATANYPEVVRYPTSVSAPNTPKTTHKRSIYKVNVPDDYDDREPLHRQDTAQGEMYLQRQRTSASAISLHSMNSRDGSQWNTQDHSRSNTMTSFRSSRVARETRSDGAHSVSQPSSPVASHAINTASSEKGKRSAPPYPRSKTEPRLSTAHTSAKSPITEDPYRRRYNRHNRDSDTYKVEYSGPVSPGATAETFSPTQSTFAEGSEAPTPKLAQSEADVQFADGYSALLAPRGTKSRPIQQQYYPYQSQQVQYQKRSDASSSRQTSVSSFSTPSQRQKQRQQQQQHLEWHQQQQQILDEQQQLAAAIAEHPGWVPPSPKTPKLGSLPRPIPRDATQ